MLIKRWPHTKMPTRPWHPIVLRTIREIQMEHELMTPTIPPVDFQHFSMPWLALTPIQMQASLFELWQLRLGRIQGPAMAAAAPAILTLPAAVKTGEPEKQPSLKLTRETN